MLIKPRTTERLRDFHDSIIVACCYHSTFREAESTLEFSTVLWRVWGWISADKSDMRKLLLDNARKTQLEVRKIKKNSIQLKKKSNFELAALFHHLSLCCKRKSAEINFKTGIFVEWMTSFLNCLSSEKAMHSGKFCFKGGDKTFVRLKWLSSILYVVNFMFSTTDKWQDNKVCLQ